MKQPNIVFVFADQWRGQATGYAGDPNVLTPHIDRLASESLNLRNTISTCPVCTPYRGSLLTGQYPLTHGLFVNDVPLDPDAVTMGKLFARAGYDTAYIGKWHVDGHGRTAYIPPERRQGFQFWRALECTHHYNHSAYYTADPDGSDSDMPRFWEGYDAIAQTREAQRYIRTHDRNKPFLLVLSWGPPHNPYGTAPGAFRELYAAERIQLRPNVPLPLSMFVPHALAGYYAHCTVLDACVGDLLATLDEQGLAEDTIFVFTADHGDAVGCQGHGNKQAPWEESILVPALLRYPARFGRQPRVLDAVIGTPDILPTLLGLTGLPIPRSIEGLDFSGYLDGGPDPSDGAALIACYHPIADWWHGLGGREYRGLRTARYTYVRSLDGPWLLFDNQADPYQLDNLVDRPEHAGLLCELDAWLQRRLDDQGDAFLPGVELCRRWGYSLDRMETVPIPPSTLPWHP
ncbi:MAG: Arylsulfatase [Chloroflexi bacterium ADurb.Bin325]|nr:MAG: Arylsulfatase [Chloroflexi bacterium ADurb.Bin325]